MSSAKILAACKSLASGTYDVAIKLIPKTVSPFARFADFASEGVILLLGTAPTSPTTLLLLTTGVVVSGVFLSSEGSFGSAGSFGSLFSTFSVSSSF
jgi:hypothetical protein